MMYSDFLKCKQAQRNFYKICPETRFGPPRENLCSIQVKYHRYSGVITNTFGKESVLFHGVRYSISV